MSFLQVYPGKVQGILWAFLVDFQGLSAMFRVWPGDLIHVLHSLLMGMCIVMPGMAQLHMQAKQSAHGPVPARTA